MLNIVHLDTIDSTNNWCKAHADELPLAVFADEQTAGRGRYGRSFYSPAGSGVYMSYAFRAGYPDGDVRFITLVAAAAVHQVLQSHTIDPLNIKWVNDIYRNGRKIAGILCERVDDTGSQDYYIIVGIGVNVAPFDVPTELENIIGFLSDDAELSVSSLAVELATALDQVLAVFNSDISELSDYIDYYKSKCYNLPDDIDL